MYVGICIHSYMYVCVCFLLAFQRSNSKRRQSGEKDHKAQALLVALVLFLLLLLTSPSGRQVSHKDCQPSKGGLGQRNKDLWGLFGHTGQQPNLTLQEDTPNPIMASLQLVTPGCTSCMPRHVSCKLWALPMKAAEIDRKMRAARCLPEWPKTSKKSPTTLHAARFWVQVLPHQVLEGWVRRLTSWL